MIQQGITESEIDEMIKNSTTNGISPNLSKLLNNYKDIFVGLEGYFKILRDKLIWGDSYLDEETVKKIQGLNERFQKHEFLKKDQRLLLKGGNVSDLQNNFNELEQALKKANDELIKIDTELWDISSARTILNKVLYKQGIEAVELKFEQKTNDKIDKIEQKILEKAVIDDANHLTDEAGKLFRSSIFWFAVIVAVSILLICLAFQNIQDLSVDKLKELKPVLENNNVFWVYVFSRLSVGIILIYFLFFAIKNYRSIKHTEFIYKQKATALQTYVFLSRNPSTKGYERELVGQIGRSVFEIHQTGYIKENQDKDSVENMNIVGEAASRLLKKE